ncbi:MAG: XylR family transcriptional regulator [Phycisphaerae bacterium]|nr:XylR family transcriptional regulator [Phycisphaerae bacterium]
MKNKKNILLALTTAHHGLYRGVARYAREHDWHLVTDMLYAANIPYGWRGDGIISHVGYWNELADFIRSAKEPRVELTNVRPDIDVPHVEGDNHQIGEIAAQHFLERGYRNFAWAPFTDDIINKHRYEGFCEKLNNNGFDCTILPPQHHLSGTPLRIDWSGHLKILKNKILKLPKPLAIFCYNDCVAANVLHACQQAEILVPEQVALVGTDNDELLCEAVTVSLTSVMHDLEGIGYQGAMLLDQQIDKLTIPSEFILVPPKGIAVRQSSDMLAVSNLQVAHALSYIWNNYMNPSLTVDKIVMATKLSRRPLEIAFRRETGRTINDEIIRVRLEKVKDMLKNTDMSVVDIATATGFTRANHLYRTFRKHFGITPRTFQAKL